MRTKKCNKKLVLNKETIVNLKNGEKEKVQGGKTCSPCTGIPLTEFCETWVFTICDNC